MMKKLVSILSVFLLSLLGLSGFVFAQDETASKQLTVVELFTSQGCSSCPPADSVLKSLRGRPGILPLSWAVDYWDRLGWEDTFAKPYHSMRQTAYNKRLGRGGVFTPQMVFNGRVQCVGSKTEKVRHGIEKAKKIDHPYVAPILRRADENFTLHLPEFDAMDLISVQVVWYQSEATVKVGDGENQGRTLHYTNIVRESKMLKDWDGSEQIRTIASERPEGADHIAVLLQKEYGHGPIVGAVYLPLDGAS